MILSEYSVQRNKTVMETVYIYETKKKCQLRYDTLVNSLNESKILFTWDSSQLEFGREILLLRVYMNDGIEKIAREILLLRVYIYDGIEKIARSREE